jgi:hypothetical protein
VTRRGDDVFPILAGLSLRNFLFLSARALSSPDSAPDVAVTES